MFKMLLATFQLTKKLTIYKAMSSKLALKMQHPLVPKKVQNLGKNFEATKDRLEKQITVLKQASFSRLIKEVKQGNNAGYLRKGIGWMMEKKGLLGLLYILIMLIFAWTLIFSILLVVFYFCWVSYSTRDQPGSLDNKVAYGVYRKK